MTLRPFPLLVTCSLVLPLGVPAAAQSLTNEVKSAVAQIRGSTGPATIQKVAGFDHQVTGVTMSETGRMFVNFPRWTEDAPVSVAEVMPDGKTKPYPDAEWNAWRNDKPLDPKTHFICVQSVVADGRGAVWVLDPAAPNTEKEIENGPKLVKIDLASNEVTQTISFDAAVAPQGSYMNDVRFAPDGSFAYVTDSGNKGAIIVVDLKTGNARRLLDHDPSVQPDDSVHVQTDGQDLKRPDGRQPQFASDGIALSPNGDTLFYQALTGNTLYRVATAALRDESLDGAALSAKVQKVAKTDVADGLWMDGKGQLFLTSPQDNSVKMLTSDGKLQLLVQDARLRWPDTFTQGPDGALYVTTSHIQDSPWFQSNGWRDKDFAVWKIVPKTGETIAPGAQPAATR